MRVLDPSCGSGAFLVRFYRKLIERRRIELGRRLRPAELGTQPSGKAQGRYRSGVLASTTSLDKTFVLGAANTLQAFVCLSSLMRVYADDSGKVRVYAKLVEEKLQALGELI